MRFGVGERNELRADGRDKSRPYGWPNTKRLILMACLSLPTSALAEPALKLGPIDTPLHPLWLIIVAGLISLVPVLMGLATSYLKVSIVLGMLKNALGASQVPSGLVVMALSLGLTLYVMGPVFDATVAQSSGINLAQVVREPTNTNLSKLTPLAQPWREFLQKHSGQRELSELRLMSSQQSGSNVEAATGEPALRELIAAFVLTELKEAFAMGFVVLLPFLVIDLVVANILVGLGMYMVSPVIVALPVKLILFVLSDAWMLLMKGLVNSYGG